MTSETTESDSSTDAEQMTDIIAGRTDSVTADSDSGSDDVGSDPDWDPEDMAVMMGSDPDDITDPRDDAEEQDHTESEQRALDAALPHEVARAADRGVTIAELYQRRYGVDVDEHSTFGPLRRALDTARAERRSR